MFWFDFFVALFGLFSSPDKKRTEAEAPVPLSEIADVAMLQAKYFCRFFKENMGISFLTFVNDVRLYYVYQELMSTNLPIGQIIAENGFTNYATFRKLFDAKFHCTPKELRNSHPDVKMDFLITNNNTVL